MRIVLDTNIIVSGLLTPFGDCATILNLLVNGSLNICYDLRILSEYEEVLSRPKFQFNRRLVGELLDFFRRCGEFICPKPLPYSLPDPKDAPFLEVAIEGRVDCLVTGNKKHYPIHLRQGIKVVSPKQFILLL